VWDKRVKEVSGGMTIHMPSIGKWVSPEGKVFEERMIPVNFIATEAQARDIVRHTIEYYEQEAVLCIKLAEDFILMHKNEI
jgi:hypothetical protein